MLRELYDDALRENLILPAGYGTENRSVSTSRFRAGRNYVWYSLRTREFPPRTSAAWQIEALVRNVLAESSQHYLLGMRPSGKICVQGGIFPADLGGSRRSWKPRLEYCLKVLCDKEGGGKSYLRRAGSVEWTGLRCSAS